MKTSEEVETLITNKVCYFSCRESNLYSFRVNLMKLFTEQFLLTVDDLAKGLDDKSQTFMILVDFSKAFDKVTHQRLLLNAAMYLGVTIDFNLTISNHADAICKWASGSQVFMNCNMKFCNHLVHDITYKTD